MVYRLFWFLLACSALPALAGEPEAVTGQQLLSDWIGLIRSGSRILIIVTSGLGIILAGVSIYRAYDASDNRYRSKHIMAAVFAGLISITGVVIGWISGLLIPT